MKNIRALVGALILAGALVAGILYADTHRDGGIPGLKLTSAFQVASDGPLQIVLGGGASGVQLVDLAYEQLQHVYYKPFDAQTLVIGERSGLLAYLKRAHLKNAMLPPIAASSTVADSGTSAADGAPGSPAAPLEYAQSHYAAALGKDGSTELKEAALRGMLSSLGDPYTVYLSPHEIQSLNEQLQGGNFGGIGVYIDQLKDGRVFVQPIAAMPAARAGMKPGEFIVSVEGKNIKGLAVDQVEQLIRGPSGTVVHMVTYPYKTPKVRRSYSIVREVIHVPTVYAKMEDGYEYIHLTTFGESSADEVQKALLNGRTHGARGYILDLRYDGGGLLDAAVRVSSYFIPQGTIVATIDRDGARNDQDALGTSIPGLKPLAVLVNKYTASASEITSGAIQDYGVGTIIGTKTFGKGVVQSIYPMPDQGALKITTARYVTPLGRDIQHRGITPDILVNQEDDPSIIDTPADKQLAAAKKRLAMEHS